MVFRCAGVQQEVQRDAETGVAAIQRRLRVGVARRDVVQNHNIDGGFMIAGSRIAMASSTSFRLACTGSIKDTKSVTIAAR